MLYVKYGKNLLHGFREDVIWKSWQATEDNVCLPTLYNLVVSFLLTAGHDTDGCRIKTMLQLGEGKKLFVFEHLE